MTHPLTRYRHDADLSMAALAAKAGTTRQTIHRIESGEQRPSWELAARLIAVSEGRLSADDFLPASSAA